jgi:hypothetical protein
LIKAYDGDVNRRWYVIKTVQSSKVFERTSAVMTAGTDVQAG